MKSSEFHTTEHSPVHYSVTVLLPRLSGWHAKLTQEQPTPQRYPALETFLARATARPALADSLDPLRLKLFGLDSGSEVPVAALCRLADGLLDVADPSYYLRLDPVILQADMSRVMMLRSGFDGFPPDYQQQVSQVVKEVLAAENLCLQDGVSGYWTLKMPFHPGVQFVSLDDALGADIADCLPGGPTGQRWKKLSNEIQMALHACAANQQRRQRGEALINSVWFWGGGSLPKSTDRPRFDKVVCVDPVSKGLARLHGLSQHGLQKFLEDLRQSRVAGTFRSDDSRAASILVDWAVPAAEHQSAQPVTPERLEQLLTVLMCQLSKTGGSIELHCPEQSWLLGRSDLRRFWRRRQPLAQQLRLLQASA